jgi:hypothetical protein
MENTREMARVPLEMLQLVGHNVRRARDGVILKSTTNKGGLP